MSWKHSNGYKKWLWKKVKATGKAKQKIIFINYLNIELTELSSWILQIASPSIFATERIFNCGKSSLTITGKHGGLIKEFGNEKLSEKKLYNAGTFQIVGSALNICPESVPKKIKNDYEKRLKQLVKESKK